MKAIKIIAVVCPRSIPRLSCAVGLMTPSTPIPAMMACSMTTTTNQMNSCNRLQPVESLSNTYCALRHGRSLANEAKVISSHPEVATVKHGLSPLGRDQAVLAADSVFSCFQRKNYDGIVILTSDYLRAKETAEIVARNVVQAGLELRHEGPVIERRLRERWFGEHDGGPDRMYEAVWKDDVMDPNHTYHGVESVNSVMARVTDCVVECDSMYQNHLVVLVAHGDVLQILQTAFWKLDGSKHRSLDHLETATLRPLELAK